MVKTVKNKQKNKYNVGNGDKNIEKRSYSGIIFASEMERNYYVNVLLPLKESGEILNIIIQPSYLLQPKFSKYGKNYQDIKYVSDFEVEYKNHDIVTVEIKGLPSETAKLKRKFWDYVYPNRTLVWISFSAKYGGWLDYDELQKLRLKNKRDKKNNGNEDTSL